MGGNSTLISDTSKPKVSSWPNGKYLSGGPLNFVFLKKQKTYVYSAQYQWAYADGHWEDPFYFREKCSLPTDDVFVVSSIITKVHFNVILEHLGFREWFLYLALKSFSLP